MSCFLVCTRYKLAAQTCPLDHLRQIQSTDWITKLSCCLRNMPTAKEVCSIPFVFSHELYPRGSTFLRKEQFRNVVLSNGVSKTSKHGIAAFHAAPDSAVIFIVWSAQSSTKFLDRSHAISSSCFVSCFVSIQTQWYHNSQVYYTGHLIAEF